MIHLTNILPALVVLTVLMSLRSNRLMALVKLMALQGIIVSAIPVYLETAHGLLTLNVILFFLLLVIVKGAVIPAMMSFAVKRVVASREVEPILGYHASLFAGLIILLASVYITNQLHIVQTGPSHNVLLVTAMTTMGAGLILLMARRKAITQVIGYLMMENGIYLIGTSLARQVHTQYVVEFAVLLDLLVAVLVMGIVLNDINHTFDDVDTALLGQLKD